MAKVGLIACWAGNDLYSTFLDAQNQNILTSLYKFEVTQASSSADWFAKENFNLKRVLYILF